MDTWIVLKDIEGQGERNRGLTIVKSRGMAHSNQFREFKLTGKGLILEDFYPGEARIAEEQPARNQRSRMAHARKVD
jgi:circadian clock protein KaiC